MTKAEKAFTEVEAADSRHVLIPWVSQAAPRGREITRAEGVYFWDSGGRRYLDFTSQFVFTNFGHGEQRVIDAIKRQAEALAEMAPPFVTAPRSEAAALVAEVAPGDLNKVFFSTSGAEANEAAFKMAKSITGRSLVCSRYTSYHGSTYGAMSLSNNPATWGFEPGVPGVVAAPGCNPYRCRHAPQGGKCTDCGEHCARDLEEVLVQHGPQNFAAVIVEPIVGSTGGVIIPGDGYLETMREICSKYGILLIADEVMTGFGRTGRWFACDHWGVVPDIMTMAKGISGGYVPMGATVLREPLAARWAHEPLPHGHTYVGHTLGSAAVAASIKVYRDDDLVTRSAEMGDYLLESASALQEKHPSVGDVRGKGLFVGAELVRNRRTKEPIGGPNQPPVKQQILRRAMDNGVFMFNGLSNHVLMFCPPLTITREQIDEGMAVVDEVLRLADSVMVS
jgi:taurine---2-oxoglutarate transaminase